MQIEKRRLECRRFLIFCTKVRGEGSAAGAAQNFVDVSDTGNGQPVGGLRGFALGDEIVIAIQGILQNFLLNVPGVFRTGKQQLHITYQLFPH